MNPTPETHGSVAVVDGEITYTAEPGYAGPASFDYLVCDDGTAFATTEEACSTRTVQVSVGADGNVVEDLRPDPVDPTLPTSLYAATAFLYSGSDPLQRDVAPGTIERRRAAVVRGTVRERGGRPLAGVRVSVEGHPEFGFTLTRTSGSFDLAVNGGGRLTLAYEKAGWSRAQRHVPVPWADYAWAPDVTLVPADASLRAVDLSDDLVVDGAAPAAASGGARDAAIVVGPATNAYVVDPDGPAQHLTRLPLRVTDHGFDGGAHHSMPVLPPEGTGATYALDLRAGGVNLNRNVSLTPGAAYYLADPGGRPAGDVLPMHSHDPVRDVWVPDGEGRVLAVLGVADGMAVVDADGDGDRDFEDKLLLGTIGVSDAELRELAVLYPAGSTVWRLLLPHLGLWAWWSGTGTGDGIDDLAPGRARLGGVAGAPAPPAQERIELKGTPLSLRATPSPAAGRTLAVPVTGAEVPAGLDRVEVTVTVAGRRHVAQLRAEPNQTHEFVWNGLDGYGRAVQGTFPARVEVTYVAADGRRRVVPAGTVHLHNLDVVGQGLGGWTLDAHQVLDLDHGRLYGGDGADRGLRSAALQRELEAVAGRLVDDAVAGPDGSLYVAAANQVRRIWPDGTVSPLAGSGRWGFDGDGGPAIQASFRGARAVALGPDGTVYVLDRWNDRVRRIGPDGIISTVAGGGRGQPPYGGPGTKVSLDGPQDLTAGPDGTLFLADAAGRVLRLGLDGRLMILAQPSREAEPGPVALAADGDGSVLVADARGARLLRLAPDGSLTPVAGGPGASGGDGGPATGARLTAPGAVASAADGTIFFVDDGRLRSIGPSGTIATLATAPSAGDAPEGEPTSGALPLRSLSVAPDGTLHVGSPEGLFRWGAGNHERDADGTVRVPSADGSEVFAFDPAGRHLRTFQAATGTPKYDFGYDAGGRLREVVVAGLGTVRIERDVKGRALAVVAPDGTRTEVAPKVVRVLASDPVLGIPAVVFQAYQEAAARARTQFACDMRWPVLAAIGRTESGHGTFGGARVNAAGVVFPPIIGIPLDGRIGTALITDTDGGRLDNDTVFDRAVGPMQFIPSTWRGAGTDGDGDGVADPHNIFDAALAAARYLCNAAPPGRFSDRDQLARAFLSYNHSSAYVAKVLADVDFYDAYDGLRTFAGPLAGAYALPVDRALVDRDPAMLGGAHHDYPALDLPVPVGSRVYAVTAGKVVDVPSGGRCGNGVVIDGVDGHRYTYCHAHSVLVSPGATVAAGRLIMLSGTTGNSSGPHLHLQIARDGGTLLCPQPLVRAWYRGVGLPAAAAPTAGCTT